MIKIDTKNIVSEIKERLQLSSVVSMDTRLVKRGSQYVGSCPLHQEKTASFFVNDSIGSYFCFGCREFGDVVQYIIKKRNVNFSQAIDILAEMAGIQKQDIRKNSIKHRQLDMLNIASEFYKEQLMHNDKILEYCKSRNIDMRSIETFCIGYSGNFPELLEKIKASGYSQNEIRDLGLEKFKNRLIFPITNKSGNVIGFGARTLDDNVVPKYINSNDSDIFHKQNILYGYNVAARNVNKTNGFIVVEGYIDVIAMHQYGFNTSIASMGTSFGQKHLQNVWQYCDNCILCFDGDLAGMKASIRASFLCIEHVKPGKNIKICCMPDGEDPASLLYSKGPEKMREILDASSYLSDFIWNYYSDLYSKITVKTPEAIAMWKREIYDMIDRIQDKNVQSIYKSEFKERIYKLTNPWSNTDKHKNNKSIDTVVSISNIRLIYECVLLYYVREYGNRLDAFIERLQEIQFKSDLTQNACYSILDCDFDSYDFDEVERIAKRYHDFGSKDESNIESFISEIFASLLDDKYDIECIERNAKNVFLVKRDSSDWDRLRSLKKQKIKQ